jgi:ornithine decarboxylase
MDKKRFITDIDWKSLQDIIKDKETPFLLMNMNKVQKTFENLVKNFPNAKIHYAVKANPAVEVLEKLHKLGSSFDVASVYELRRLLSLGVPANKISYGNTIKKYKDIIEHYQAGVRLYSSDSEADIRNLSKSAPGSKVFIRVLTEGSATADWPLSRKFGCDAMQAEELLILAHKLGLVPFGLTFHVGSQQRDITAWETALNLVKSIMTNLKEKENIELKAINMGGGFPANYITPTEDLSAYAAGINTYLEKCFGANIPEIILEPGRSLVADSGIIVSEVVLDVKKSNNDTYRWIYTDIGMFSGMIETLGEALKYPLYTEKTGECGECIIAGPTCDSQDILYEEYKYNLPLSLEIGDKLYWFTTGAYTTSYSSIEFNGFPPLKTYYF